MHMKNLKREYLAPEVEVLELALQGVIAASGKNEGLGSSVYSYGNSDFD